MKQMKMKKGVSRMDLTLGFDSKMALMEMADIVTVDTEGVGIMLGLSVAFDGIPDGFYFPVNHATDNITPEQLQRVYEILASRSALVFHNAVHDLRVLTRAGLNYRGKFYDTMLMAHWINEERMDYSLDKISQVYGGKPKAMPDTMKFIIEVEGWNAVPASLMESYAGNDAFITHQLFRKLLPEFEAQGFSGSLWDLEQEFIRDVMGPMMDLGIKIDTAFCVREYMKGIAIMKECEKELGFNPNSPKQLKEFLIDELKLPVLKHTKSCELCKKRFPVAKHSGPPSFDKDAMQEYDEMLEGRQDPRAKTILRYRGWMKTTSSNYKPYMELIDEQGILHPGYKLHGTKTGRLSCANPNLQQIPKSSDKEWNGNLKRAFIPREGYNLWEVDYSQLQYRMTCAYAEQEDLIEVFNDPTRDVFTEQANDMVWERQNVKTLVYLILFGGGANRASVAFGVGIEKGKELVEEFHSRYPRIRKIANDAQKVAGKLKYVRYWTGRRRHFFPNGAPTYRAFNAVIQGGEAEIMKRAMIYLQREVCDENCRMILQIHDAIAFEIRTGMEDHYLPRIIEVMERAPKDFCKAIGVDINFYVDAHAWGSKETWKAAA